MLGLRQRAVTEDRGWGQKEDRKRTERGLGRDRDGNSGKAEGDELTMQRAGCYWAGRVCPFHAAIVTVTYDAVPCPASLPSASRPGEDSVWAAHTALMRRRHSACSSPQCALLYLIS